MPLTVSWYVQALDALQKCRTAALGGHIDYCDCCGEQRISYNSCGNRHCPKCRGQNRLSGVEDRMNDALEL
ncbi:MAG: transposase zinc-binding domain-containing protein [Bacteroidales bacterium]|nr:transposase zinc-binding domain-containing protein [Bacteroidales bacterium]